MMYVVRYMDTMESNPEGYAATSLINTFELLRRYISIWVLACPGHLVLMPVFLLLSGHGLGQAKTQIEI
nr:MAG TPA: hypothetical protein [Caudoviricetes sp.]